MPIIKSAKKRVKVANKAAIRNSKTKRSLKTAVKTFAASLTNGKKIDEAHAKAISELDKAVKKGVIHKNKAARKKQQLATKAKSVAKAKKPAAKPAAKKAPAKKTAATKK